MNMLSMLKCGADIIKSLNVKIERNDYLDPLSVIVILALNSYYPLGTKLAIHSSQIYLQTNNILQGPQRYFYGDKKTDINILYYPIIYATRQYILNLNNDLLNLEQKEELVKLFEKSKIGLIKLRDTYINEDIIYSINRLIDIIDKSLKNKQINDQFNETINEDSIKFKIYDEINKIWSIKHIKCLLLLFEELEKRNDNNRKNLILSIEYFIKDIEYLLLDKINFVFKL